MNGKFAIIIPDGAADYPLDCFDGKTIFEAAEIPHIHQVAQEGRQGMARTVPQGMTPGSDVAMMSVLGYDPAKNYTGRAPIEAVAQNIDLGPDDWVFRCNLVTLADDIIADHSAGHITTQEATQILNDLKEVLSAPHIAFYPGVSYRHLCVIKGIDFSAVSTQPPHDVLGQKFAKHLPKGKNAKVLNDLISRSWPVLENHPINRIRRDLGENPATSIWLWGQGQKAILERFSKKYGKNGAAITAVDLVRGLAKLIGFDLIHVPGATGFLDTNYAGKGQAAVQALEKYDLVLVHIEATDEAGHSGNPQAKKKALEQIDQHIVKPVYEALKKYPVWRILIMPDHPTPVDVRAHTAEPVPFVIAGTGIKPSVSKPFSELNSKQTGLIINKGADLMEFFLKI